MGLFRATIDTNVYSDFHIEELNPKYNKNVGINQVWEINNSATEAEVYVEEETLREATIKALLLFEGKK